VETSRYDVVSGPSGRSSVNANSAMA
jgi:hypothetical protein